MNGFNLVPLACALAFGSSIAGCGHSELHEVLLRPPAVQSGEPEVYFEGKVPTRPYYEAAILQAIGYGGDATLETLVGQLTRRGSSLGCDALVRVRMDRGTTKANATAVCVRWSPVAPSVISTSLGPSPAPAPPPVESESSPPPSSP